MSTENPLNDPPRETPKPEEKKPEQLIKEPNAEERNLSEEREERYKQWMKDHPETVITPENLRECGPEIAEFEEMLASFELIHDIAELHLIIDLKPEDAPKYPLRESAKVALTPIVAKLNMLKKETNITPEKHAELKVKYMYLSRAVGRINNNKVDHNR